MINKLEQPLYPKLSSIYNKILQLVSAILLIVMLMVLMVTNTQKSNQVLTQHFEQTADNFLQQAIAGVSILIDKNQLSINKKERYIQLQSYLNSLAEADFIKQVHLYDQTGLLLLKSESDNETNTSIKLLYGIDEGIKTSDKSQQYVPFIKEIRHNNLMGYLRLTIEKSYLTEKIAENNYHSETFTRILLIIAGLIGFLLTRGLNRFSRQGYRVAK